MLLLASFVLRCTPRETTVPDVLGIKFGIPVSDLESYLPEDAKPETYMVPMYGYKLIYPNPDNWDVIVEEGGPDGVITTKSIWKIYIAKALTDDCAQNHTELHGITVASRSSNPSVGGSNPSRRAIFFNNLLPPTLSGIEEKRSYDGDEKPCSSGCNCS
jgi:hypothetical protein